jgi:two-component system, LuxR family, response regulator FixJ
MVYVIDDDDAVRDSISMLLEAHAVAVRTYASAAAFLRDVSPAWTGCLLVDVNKPGMTGLELLDQLRERGIALPAIVMTGGLTASIPQITDRYAVPILQKPFRPKELIARIEEAFGRHHA